VRENGAQWQVGATQELEREPTGVGNPIAVVALGSIDKSIVERDTTNGDTDEGSLSLHRTRPWKCSTFLIVSSDP
jgi:hypothetical protein